MIKPALTDARFRAGVTTAAQAFGVTPDDVLSRRRSHSVSLARHAFVAALVIETEASYSEIARRVERDHTTVMYAMQTAIARAIDDVRFANGLATVMGAIRDAA